MSGRTIHRFTLFDIEAVIAVDFVLELRLWVGNLADLIIVVDEIPIFCEMLREP